MSLIEKIARDIADALGDNFDYAFNSKPEWTAARGETKAGFRDVNQPYKSDYLDAAQAALTAIMGEGDGVPSTATYELADKIVFGKQPVGKAAQLIHDHLATMMAAFTYDRVQQCDRDAAASIMGWTEGDQNNIRNARMDNCDEVQAFARHRSTAAAAERARRDAEIVAWLRGHEAFSHIGGKFMADAIERGEV